MDLSIIRITKELSELQKGTDLSLAVACRDIDVRNIRALILGPHGTPYEFGFFEFAIRFEREYPSKPPTVRCITTNYGHTRFNPNIYANGKVCLSILGTWRGEPGEEWSSAQGLESILLSIQSLMSSNPYENEPGFENAKAPHDVMQQDKYRQKIRHEAIRVSIINRLESYLNITPDGIPKPRQPEIDEDPAVTYEPFKDLCKRRFLWYHEHYLADIKRGQAKEKEGTEFVRMAFESLSNTMDGVFRYSELEKRFNNVKNALFAEEEAWIREGAQSVANEETVAVNLAHQFKQVSLLLKGGDMPHSVELVDDNPFVWIFSYFGRPMTNLDGGLFKIRMVFSPRFPEEQPRVRFLTKIFHHLVTADGIPCYTPKTAKRDDARSHLNSIVSLLEDDEPAYDPRKIVNLEAHKLFWDKDASSRKQYNRLLRRSAQDSMDEQ